MVCRGRTFATSLDLGLLNWRHRAGMSLQCTAMSALSQTRVVPRSDPLAPLEQFVREYVELSGGVWDEIEPQVYDLLIDDEPVRITFDPEALPEHPSAQLASLGTPLMDRLLGDAQRAGAHTVLYAGGLNARPHDLPGRLRRAFTIPEKASLTPTGVRLCFFPQAAYRFVATFTSDQKEQASLELALDLHSGREVRQLGRLLERAQISDRPVEALPEAPHLSLHAGFTLACRQVARSLAPLANQRRRELCDHTGRQIERMQRYYGRMLDELDQQPQRISDPAEAAARKVARADAIHRERLLRIAELRHKSLLRVSLALSHVLIIHLPKLLVRFEVSPGPGKTPSGKVTTHEAIYDLITEVFEPITPAGGGAPTFDLSGTAR